MNSPTLPLAHAILTDRNIAIKVVGVGGAGSNTVDRLKMDNLDRLQVSVINTDAQALAQSPVHDKILIGASVTRGLGAGGDPDLGRAAAEADREKIAAIVQECDLVFLVAGMGGGTGSGAAPTVAEIAAENGALVIAFVTMPFSFEGGRRNQQAEDGLAALRKVCDAVIPLPNDLLMQEAREGETALHSFARADEWIGRGVKTIWSMLYRTGLINLDFATLREAFHTRSGKTLFSLGTGSGADAVNQAIAAMKFCPLLATPEFARKADRLLVNIIGGPEVSLKHVHDVMNAVAEQFGRDAHLIMGAVIDEDMQGQVELMVLGTSDLPGRTGSRRSAQSARAPRGAAAAAAQAPAPTAPATAIAHGTSASPVSDPALSRTLNPPPDLVSSPTLFPPETPAAPRRASASTAEKASRHSSATPVAQDEFAFGETESRGQFDKTERNLFEGQDLDVPTYFRRAIRLAL